MENRSFALMLGALFLLLAACEKPYETEQRIAKTPRYALTDLTVSEDGRHYIICTEWGTVERTSEWVVIKYDTTVTVPMVKDYLYGDLRRTELIFKDRESYLGYLEKKAKVLSKWRKV